MAKCVKCGADTSLHVNGVPLCLACDAKLVLSQKRPSREAAEVPRKERGAEGNGAVNRQAAG